MKAKQLLLIASITLAAACNLRSVDSKNTKYKPVIKKGTYKLMLPDFLDSTSKLHKEASLQYVNPLKEFYVIVIDEDRLNLQNEATNNEALKDYFPDSLSLMQNYFNYMTKNLSIQPSYKLFDTAGFQIKKANARTGSVSVILEKAEIFYRLAAIEANKNVYQIYIWTLQKNKEKYQPIMDSIIRSLREF